MIGALNNVFCHQNGKNLFKSDQYIGVYERELTRCVKKWQPAARLEIRVKDDGSPELWSNHLPLGSDIIDLDKDPNISDRVSTTTTLRLTSSTLRIVRQGLPFIVSGG